MKKLLLFFGFLFASISFLTGCQSNNKASQLTLLSQPTRSATPLPTITPLITTTTLVDEGNPQSSSQNQGVTPMPTLIATQLPYADPTPITPTEPTPQQFEHCLDEAAFYADVTVPDGEWLDAGEPFTKTWQVRNTGTCTWGDGYALVFASGDIMNGALSNTIPEVSPGEIIDISVNLIAPARGGEHTGNWEFQNSQGNRFGVGSGSTGYIWVQIQVNWYTVQNTQTLNPQPISTIGNKTNCEASEDAGIEMQILSMINSARSEQGLPELSINTALQQAAVSHSLDMACQDFVDHTGSDSSTWYDRASEQGYANANSARENIYVGNPEFGGDAQGAFSWWMNSQVHRDNILLNTVSEIGIGYVYNQDSTYGGYFTALFAHP